MEIDIYQTCPCQSGKKIKFCCGKSIVSDLNRIVELSGSHQAVAALEHIDRTIARQGVCDCLTTLKTHVLLTLREYDEADQVNHQFLLRNPHSPVGHQHRSLLAAARGETQVAVQALQDAMDLLPGTGIPRSMATAFRTAGMLLLSDGHLAAGREHLVFSNELNEEPALEPMVSRTWRSADIPLTLKRNLQAVPPPPDAPEEWREACHHAVQLAGLGRWRAARQRLTGLNEQFPGQPVIVDALARMSLALGDEPDAVRWWQEMASLPGLTLDERAELQALIFTIGQIPLSAPLDVVRVSFPLVDADGLTGQLATHPRLVQGVMTATRYHEDGPPPLAGGMLLDRDRIQSPGNDEKLPATFPRALAEFLVYGKRTDRQGRVDLFLVHDSQAADTIAGFTEIAGGSIGTESGRVVVDETSELENVLDVRWQLPPDLDSLRRREFLARQREHEYLEVWPDQPMLPLAGQTPAEAMQRNDELLNSTVAALILLLEQAADFSWWNSFDFDRLRDQLGLPRRSPPAQVPEGVLNESPLMLQRLDFESLKDETLIACFFVGSMTGNYRMLRKCLPVILDRPHLDSEAPLEQVHALLARITADNDTALELMQRARQHATARQRDVGQILVMELDLRLQRDLADGVQELLGVIEGRHMQDAQVQYQLAMVLQKYGLLQGEGRPPSGEPAPAEPVSVGSDETRLWTPESGHPPAAPPESGSSKLWLPE